MKISLCNLIFTTNEKKTKEKKLYKAKTIYISHIK